MGNEILFQISTHVCLRKGCTGCCIYLSFCGCVTYCVNLSQSIVIRRKATYSTIRCMYKRKARDVEDVSQDNYPDSKVHGANMGPTWVLSASDGPHVGPMSLSIIVIMFIVWSESLALLNSADDATIHCWWCHSAITRPDNCDVGARTSKAISNTLDIDFAHGHIHNRSCKETVCCTIETLS